LTANALLGGFIFYQFIPLLALDPIKYFGAKLLMSPMPTDFHYLFTLPLFGALVIVGFFQLVYNFSKKDF
jgi:Flp pilus assembly protein protease CpaA